MLDRYHKNQFEYQVYFINLVTMIFLVSVDASPFNRMRKQCEDIRVPMCKDIGYNVTSMPNQFYHQTQKEAGLEVHQFWPLVEIQCSKDLRFFLCSIYIPICMPDYEGSIPACRSVCERAQLGCAPIMKQYGFAWPERMNCGNLPEYGNSGHVCMDELEGGGGSSKYSMSNTSKTVPSHIGKDMLGRETRPTNKHPDVMKTSISNNSRPSVTFDSDCVCQCRYPMISLKEYKKKEYYNKVESGGVLNCALSCHGLFHTKSEHVFATIWLSVWGILCCLSTTLTVTTFMIDKERFRYPERPIIFLSGCYFMTSIGYLIRIGVGHEAIACDEYIIRYQSSERSAMCIVVFLLIYFFGMASSLWWVMLTLTWLLAAGMKWGNEAIAGCSLYFHLVAWAIPAMKTIAILSVDGIDGDPVAGICYVGNQNVALLRRFVLIPLCVYLMVGTSFLLGGFIELFRIRSIIRQQERDSVDKLEKLMVRIGIFSVLYTVPATSIIGCYIYEHVSRDTWERSTNCPCSGPDLKPDYSVFMLKYFMFLIVGITSGFWIWSEKTLESWKKFFARLCRLKTRPNHWIQEDVKVTYKTPCQTTSKRK
ncbi:frizzled-5-like [Limulus polyphemus]|uniref:Frizzled-5-like n=1 Tax=Limulus polyphemus TaxID=6850 RepID=A0ABM1STP7_LIMPO|nr:frizzled-5-like [Limulus polyphemus]